MKTFNKKTLSAAILSALVVTPIYAQENPEDKKKDKPTDIEVIEVKGFKGSLQRAMNAKRFSDSVTDSIHAEDVGKSTDQNIADALSRVTGVTVQEDAGEGTRISVRGAGPSLNQISVNGVTLTGGLSSDGSNAAATNDNSVDLSSFSADILSAIDVVKTAAADQNEGSLGANINLRTVKPLGLGSPRRSFTVEGRYNEFSDEADSRLNFSFSDKFFDEKFGFIITASKDTQKTRQDRITTDWANGAIRISDIDSATGRPATDLTTGKPIRVLEYLRDDEGNILTGDDGQMLTESVDSLANYDPETQMLHEGDLFVLAREVVDFGLNTDQRDRLSISTGLQFRPTDALDIQLDLTKTQQDVYTDNHMLRMNISPVTPLIHANDDNVSLNVVDLSTGTLERSTSRSIGGNFLRATGLREIDTDVASLTIDYIISDNLTMNLTAGYSKTLDETPDYDDKDRFVTLGTNTWGTAGRQIVEGMPDDILEPVGYDCSKGDLSECTYITGTTEGSFDPLDGSAIEVHSRFNPFDYEHNHLGFLTFRNNRSEDVNKSVFLDFDYLLDGDFITSIEFGAKWAKRSRDISISNVMVTNGNELTDLDDPDADFEVRGMGTIKLSDMMSGDAFPYNDFADGIQGDRGNEIFGGWPMLDADKALEVVAGRAAEQLGVRTNNNGTRSIETETQAFYFKTNFELLDGDLTGNFGVRYVKDQNQATGLGGITFVRFPQMVDPYNLIVERGLANIEGAPACPEAQMGQYLGAPDTRATPANDSDLQNCFAWQVTHGYNRSNDDTIPYVDGAWVIPGADGATGPDVNRLVFGDFTGPQPVINQINELPTQIYDQNGNLVNTSGQNWAHFAQAGHMWPFLDRTTAFTGPNGDVDSTYIRSATVTNTGEQDVILPSLNLNYAINSEMISRFAVSRTMTRPRIDSLNPRTQVNEQQWDAANGAAGNTNLKPLKSTNIDVSWEWYFNESSMLSIALFHKDMDDFEETVVTPFHYKDVRTEYDLQSADLLLPFDENRTPGDADNCMPLRQVAGFFTQWRVECDVANIAIVKNSKGANIKGLEFGYTQNYDFLPGVLSGLGASINYTYQSSESDPEEIGTSGVFLKPLPQPYTPEHSANTTVYWEKDGIQLRLANRYNSEQLVDRGLVGGATWQEATNRLDFSSSYQLTKNLSLTFHALNITDDTRRVFFTSANTRDAANPNSQEVVMDEGNVFDDSSITTTRTAAQYKTGRQFRVGIRGSF